MKLADQVIKTVTTKTFSIELLKKHNDLYYVRYEKAYSNHQQLSESIKDYGVASYLFDLKIRDLEGN